MLGSLIIGGLLGLAGAAAGAASSANTNRTNANIAENTNQNNLQIARETNALNEKLQREQWDRDDHAYQRTVQDMQAAGLNPLSGVSPQSSPLSAQMQASQMQPYTQQPLDFNFMNNLSDLIVLNKQLEQRDKEINLRSIAAGVDPSNLSSGSDSILYDYRNAVKALGDLRSNQSAEAAKNASSPYVKGEGSISQTLKDLKGAYHTGVEILDSILNSQTSSSKRSNNPVHDSSSSDSSARNYNPHYKKSSSVDLNGPGVINKFRRYIRGK